VFIGVIIESVIVPIPYVLFFGTSGYVAWGLGRGGYEAWRNWRQGRSPLTDEDEEAAEDLGEELDGPASGR
jgi:hypothetical protein